MTCHNPQLGFKACDSSANKDIITNQQYGDSPPTPLTNRGLIRGEKQGKTKTLATKNRLKTSPKPRATRPREIHFSYMRNYESPTGE
jgi:hypothetical protein